MRVVICGAGIAGLGLAHCLRRHGHTALVVERRPALRGEGYMIDFFGAGFDAAERLGLIPELERVHCPVGRLVRVDARGRELFSMEYLRLRRRFFGGRHFNFLRGDLESVLYARVKGNAPVRFGVTVDSFEELPDGVRVRLSDGTAHDVDALVGADGVHSHVRRLAFGDGRRFERRLGFWTAAFVLDRVPAGLPPSNDFFVLNAPDRQVAVYPIPRGRLAALFVHRTRHASTVACETGPLDEFRARYADLGWVVPELLDQCCAKPAMYCDWATQVELPQWRKGRVTLVGDACQCVSLLAGEGASLALAGAYILAEGLDALAGDVGQALERYEQRVKPWIARKQAAGRRLAEWFVPETERRLALRDLVLRLSSSAFVAPFVRRGLRASRLALS